MRPAESRGRMVWKTCLRLAWERRMRPACSISQRSRPAAVAAAPHRVALHLLPGWTRALGSKAIQLRPEADQELVDGCAAGIQQAQRLSLQGIGQADGKRERLGVHRFLTPVRQEGAVPARQREGV